MDTITSFDDIRPWLDAHHHLWQLDEFRTVGRFHACIDAADVKIESKIFKREPAELYGLSKFERVELTSFGHKVGADVPRWWVFGPEPKVSELWNDTKQTFSAAQKLVRSVEKLCRKPALTYEHIIQELGVFLQRHRSEVETLLAYSDSLAAKHNLGPAILFSYAVWGSTRRGDRTLARSPARGVKRLRLAAELALGIQHRFGPTLLSIWNDLIDEAYEATGDTSISASTLLFRAQVHIRENVVTYFTKVRDSLRHIDNLCQEFMQREHLYADDRFIRRLIKKISSQRSAIEAELWDIKETLEMWSAPADQKEAAAIKFVERVAAFANNRGGILIIGVTDGTHSIVGVGQPENRIKKIETALRRHIDTQVDFVRIRAVPFELAGETITCVIVVVGKAEVPIGVRRKDGSYSYPLRVGPETKRVPREEIATAKAHSKGTEFTFASELEAWVSDVT